MTSDSKMKVGKPETITWLSNQLISIKHSLNVSHKMSHLIRADKHRNTQFFIGGKKLEALLVFPNNSGLPSGWNWIPMSLGVIGDIYRVGIEMLARGESRWSLKGNMMNLRGKEVHYQERRSAWCGVQGGQGEWWWWWRSAEWNRGAQIQAKECLSSGAAHLCWTSPKGREVKSLVWNRATPDRGRAAPILKEECRQKCSMEQWMKYQSMNPDWGAPMGIEKRLL